MAQPRSIDTVRPAAARVSPLAPPAPEADPIALGAEAADRALGGGLARGALHEVYAAGGADIAAATGFVAALAHRAAGARPILWLRQDALDPLEGELHAPGLAEIGLAPARILLVRAPDARALLRAGGEGARSAAPGVVIIEPLGEPRLLDLTATRRLSLAARASATPVLLLRAGASPMPSAAVTRWMIAAAPSRAQPGNAPGWPAFRAELARQRGGPGGLWTLEWNRDALAFDEHAAAAIPSARPAPVSRTMVPLGTDRAAGASARRAA